MNVTTKIKMDLRKPDITLGIDAVQGDSYSRSLEIALYTGITPWKIPEGTTVSVRYCKPDGTKGFYDTLPDGTPAWHAQENLLTITLAPQMLTVAGTVMAQLEMVQEERTLSTFGLKVYVEENLAAGLLSSQDYINWLQWIKDQSDKHGQIVVSAAEKATQAAQSALTYSIRANTSADTAANSASCAVAASAAAEHAQTIAEDIAADISAIVAGNEAYTKRESDLRYSPSIIQTQTGEYICVSDSAQVPLHELHLYGKTTHSGTPCPEHPVSLVNIGSDGTLQVQVLGNNLCQPTVYSAGLASSKGFIRKNTPVATPYSANAWGGVGVFLPVIENTTYTVSADITPNRYFTVTFYKDTNISSTTVENAIGFREFTNVSKATFTTPAGCGAVAITAVNNVTSEFTWSYWQVEFGNTATAHVPYDEQILTVPTPNGLPGIPVASGGNFTDKHGQQWVCDEIDFARGVAIQKIGKIDSYHGESIGDVYLSNTGALSTGAQVLYPLEESIETSLCAEICSAYASIHMLYPCTNLFSNAGIGLSYVTDLKAYIQNQLANVR